MKHFYFFVLLFLGIFLISGNAYACGSTYKNDHSTIKRASAKCEKECCTANHKDKKHDCCHHSCKNSKCICAPPSSVFLVGSETFLQAGNYDFRNKKHQFNYPETSISSGFSSLYLKPKIG